MIKLVPYLFALKNNKILTQVIDVLLQYFQTELFFCNHIELWQGLPFWCLREICKYVIKNSSIRKTYAFIRESFASIREIDAFFFAKVNRLLAKLTRLFAKLMRLSRRYIFFTYISQWLIFLNNSNVFSLVIMRYICCSFGWELYFSIFSS